MRLSSNKRILATFSFALRWNGRRYLQCPHRSKAIEFFQILFLSQSCNNVTVPQQAHGSWGQGWTGPKASSVVPPLPAIAYDSPEAENRRNKEKGTDRKSVV